MSFINVDRHQQLIQQPQQHDYSLQQTMMQNQMQVNADVEAAFQLATMGHMDAAGQQHLANHRERLQADLIRLGASIKAMTNSPGGHCVMTSAAALDWMETRDFDPQALATPRAKLEDREKQQQQLQLQQTYTA